MGRMRDEESIRIVHNVIALMSMSMLTLFISESWRKTTDRERTSFREEN